MSVAIDAKPFDIATHNGHITVVSDKTGEHRTIRIHTEKWVERDASGEVLLDEQGKPKKKAVRTIGLLTGSDNENDYQNFALVGDDGRVVLWKKYRGGRFHEWLAKYLSRPEDFPQIECNFEGRCRVCNRLLTTPESVLRGIGPVCEEQE